MADHTRPHPTLDDWIDREAVGFSIDSEESVRAAVDAIAHGLDPAVQVLGLGEALHGSEQMLGFRNLVFRRLVERHGFTSIAMESSFPRGRLVDEYIAGRGPTSYDEVQEAGFSHGFGRAAGNRELIEWMRRYNADPAHAVKLRFYGFDSPTEMMSSDSPRVLLEFALDALARVMPDPARVHRERIAPLIGENADWENPAAAMDPAKSIGGSERAAALRVETEELISTLQVRRPQLVAAMGSDSYLEAFHHAVMARQMLTYHAAVARPASDRVQTLLGIRDVMIAETLEYAAAREAGGGRGRVLAFGHNGHLQRGMMRWELGANVLEWWAAGAQLEATMGRRYAVIGTGIAGSAACGIGPAENETLEAKLGADAGSMLIRAGRGCGLPEAELAALPTRSRSTTNSTFFPLSARSVAGFEWLAVLRLA
jgi:erythromycin esterase